MAGLRIEDKESPNYSEDLKTENAHQVAARGQAATDMSVFYRNVVFTTIF